MPILLNGCILPIGGVATGSRLFKASALWADAFYKSKCPSVCLSVRVCVCSLLRYRLNVFLPPLPEVGCPIFLVIRNPWGKVMERSGLRFEHFCLKIVKNCRAIFFIFFCWFCLKKHGGNHASRWIRNLWSKGVSLNLAYLLTFLSFCVLDDFFRYSWSTLLWHRCYDPHRSRDALSPVCGFFFL